MARLLAYAMTFALAGCGLVDSETPPCRAGIPAQNELLRSRAFAPLRYHKRTNFEISRGAGFELWADSRFEYKAALEFSLVPSRNSTSGDRFCSDAVAIRLASPLDEPRREMLHAFVRSVANRTSLKADALQAQVDALVANGAKYRPLARDGSVSAEGGMVSHPNRGDMIVVAFIWQ